MEKLQPVALWHRMAANTVALGPATIFRHGVGAKNLVQTGLVESFHGVI